MKTRAHTFQFAVNLRDVHLRDAEQAIRENEMAVREQAAYEKGRRDGERSLGEQLLRQRADLLALEQGVLQSLTEAVPNLLETCEAALAELSLEIATKLVAGLQITPEVVEAAVRDALGDLEKNIEYQVYLNDEDLELLNRIESPILQQKSPTLHFHPSDEVTRGGCMIKTPFGIIDARREVKLEALQKSLRS
jgi:flagellar assembly protein FliH